jgi:hypothetical protein
MAQAEPEDVKNESASKESNNNNHGVHVAAWKKDEVHEIPKNNYPVGELLESFFCNGERGT